MNGTCGTTWISIVHPKMGGHAYTRPPIFITSPNELLLAIDQLKSVLHGEGTVAFPGAVMHSAAIASSDAWYTICGFSYLFLFRTCLPWFVDLLWT